MPNLFFIQPSIFNEFEVMQYKKPIRIFCIKSEAEDFKDRLNVDMIIEALNGFLCTHGGKVPFRFVGNALKHALHSKGQLQEFVSGGYTLKQKGKASGVFVWHLLDEFVVHSITHLHSTQQPYAKAFLEVQQLVTDYYKMYAPSLFKEEYKTTPAMYEYLHR